MKLMRCLISKCKGLFVATVFGICSVSLLTQLWNRYLSNIIDHVAQRKDIKIPVIITAFGMILGLAILNYISTMISGYLGEMIGHKMRMGYVEYLLQQSVREAEATSVGEQMSFAQNELNEIATYMGDGFVGMIQTGITFVMTILFLLYQNPWLTLITHLPVVFILGYIAVTSRIIQTYAVKAQEQKARMNGCVETMTNELPILHLYDAIELATCIYDQEVNRWEKAIIRLESKRAILMSLSAMLSRIPFLLLLVVGGMFVVQGKLTIGGVFLFINLTKYSSVPLMNLSGYIATMRSFLANLTRVEGRILL